MIIVQILFILLLFYISILLIYTMVRGAPYAPIGKKRMDTMFELLNPKKGKLLVDLGSGDGRIVIEAAKRRLVGNGMEINPLLVAVAKAKIKKQKISNANIFLCDFWQKNLAEFDYITVYGTTPMMGALEKKLLKELKKGAKVVSNHFRFPNWKVAKQKNDVFLYIK